MVHLVGTQGNTVASYDYDPYGNIISATGSMAQINPLHYRGYYYDTELEIYGSATINPPNILTTTLGACDELLRG